MFRLNGLLATVPFGDLVQVISTNRKSGTLVLRFDEREGMRFVFAAGFVVFALHRLESGAEHEALLALAQQDLLTSGDVERLTQRMISEGRPVSELLLETLDQNQIESALFEHTTRLFGAALRKKTGIFELRETREDERCPLEIQTSVSELMLSGVQLG